MLLILLVSAAICGFIGVAIANNKLVSPAVGFVIGFLLGPIGLVIVAFMNPTDNKSLPREFTTGDRDLNSDAYRLWLVRKFGIERNNTLEKYTVGNEVFSDLEGALRAADSKIADINPDIKIDAAQKSLDSAESEKMLPWVIGGTVIIVLAGLYLQQILGG